MKPQDVSEQRADFIRWSCDVEGALGRLIHQRAQLNLTLRELVEAAEQNTGAEPSVSRYHLALDDARLVLRFVKENP